jgi:hypothetical protein
MKWPQAMKLAEKIKEIQENPPSEGLKKKKGKRIKSAFPGKKKRIKKGKKKTMKKKLAETETRTPVDQPKPRKQFEELFKDESSSSSRRKNSDSEQPVPPYDYYQYQARAKTPPRHLDSFGQAEFSPPAKIKEKTPEVQNPVRPPSNPVKEIQMIDKEPQQSIKDIQKQGKESQNSLKEIQNPVRQVVKVEKYSSDSSKSSSKGKKSSGSSSESYESNPEIEKIDLLGHLKRNDEKKDFEGSSSEQDEYRSEDYEKYQSSKESSDKKMENEPKLKKHESQSDQDYGDDYENSSQSSDKSSSSSSGQADYDQDFEDQEENHPVRKVDKSFPVSLPLGEENRKKITYENNSSDDATFFIKSSHPELMSVKDEELVIRKAVKEKIQLRFAPMIEECEKKYYLYIDKDSSPWECIEIVAQYQ